MTIDLFEFDFKIPSIINLELLSGINLPTIK